MKRKATISEIKTRTTQPKQPKKIENRFLAKLRHYYYLYYKQNPKVIMFKKQFKNTLYKILRIILICISAASIILLVLRLFGYNITWINLISSLAVYFAIEEFVKYIKDIIREVKK